LEKQKQQLKILLQSTNDANKLKILEELQEIQEKIDAYIAGGLGE
jgi:hypothetical protein